VALVATPASADTITAPQGGQIFYSNILVSGAGYGAVTSLLDFKGLPSTGSVSGCVTWNGTTDIKSGCTIGSYGTFDSDQTNSPDWKSQTVDILTTGVPSPFDLAIVFNPSESSAISVDKLAVTFYKDDGTALYIAELASPQLFLNGGSGTGGAGFVFGLDYDSALAIQNILNTAGLNFSSVRIGLSSDLSQFDSHTVFFVGDVPGLVAPVVPEPATLGLMGSALLGLAYMLRRRRKQG
jgi:hypothetical protein